MIIKNEKNIAIDNQAVMSSPKVELNDIPVLLTRLPFSLPEFWCVGIVTPNLHNCDMKIKLLFKADLQLIINTDLSSH